MTANTFVASVEPLHPGATLSADEIAHWKPFPMPPTGMPPMALAQQRMQRTGQWQGWQLLGRRFPIGCVALEITQRCNLDCTYCYLSTSSEALKDIPLAEVFRRIDMIRDWYGPGVDVQVTGGDPTLRRRDELVAIVARLTERGLRASLFTNGIKASRDLLSELCAVGLEDVAFHVDTTQERKGYRTEADLNSLRDEYLTRADGLPLSVFFNTTVHAGNLAEVPMLARYFMERRTRVRLASFQIGADIGRGEARARVPGGAVAVRQAIARGVGAALDFSAMSAGHADCNGYAYALVIGEGSAARAFDFLHDAPLVHEIAEASRSVRIDRARLGATTARVVRFLASHPGLAVRVAWRAARFAVENAGLLAAAKGRVGKVSFFVHDFMDATALDRSRCDACAFMVMTPEGPLSMCVHNAKRDDYLLSPTRVDTEGVVRFFDPATGQFTVQPSTKPIVLTRKSARGRAKEGIARPTQGSNL
jgi:hypothetical protein